MNSEQQDMEEWQQNLKETLRDPAVEEEDTEEKSTGFQRKTADMPVAASAAFCYNSDIKTSRARFDSRIIYAADSGMNNK